MCESEGTMIGHVPGVVEQYSDMRFAFGDFIGESFRFILETDIGICCILMNGHRRVRTLERTSPCKP